MIYCAYNFSDNVLRHWNRVERRTRLDHSLTMFTFPSNHSIRSVILFSSASISEGKVHENLLLYFTIVLVTGLVLSMAYNKLATRTRKSLLLSR